MSDAFENHNSWTIRVQCWLTAPTSKSITSRLGTQVSDSQMREGPNTPKCTEDPGTLDGEGLRTAGNESELREGPKVMSLLRGTKYTEVHQGPRYTERDWGVRTCHWQFATRTGPVLLLSAIRRSTPRISRRVFSSTFNWRRQRTQGAVA